MHISMKFLFLVFSLQILYFAPRVLTKPLNESAVAKESVVEKWNNMDRMIRDAMESLTDMVLPRIYSNVTNLKITTLCLKEILQLGRGLRDLKPWSLKFIDASGKGIDGLMNGALMSFGSYDECLDIRVPSKRHPQKVIFRGQYCILTFLPFLPGESEWDEFESYIRNISNKYSVLKPVPKYLKKFMILQNGIKLSLRSGACVPSGCTRDDVDQIINMVVGDFMIDGQAMRCEMREKVKFSPDQIFSICCFSAVGLLVCIATFLDAYPKYAKRIVKFPLGSLLSEFSVTRTIRALVTTKNSNDSLRCLNGIRFITTVWIVWYHSYTFLNFWALGDTIFFLEARKSFPFLLFTNGTLNVDTFFVIGGFLICYKIVKTVKCNISNFSMFSHVLTRIFRIVPSYVFLLMSALLTNTLGSGPIWHEAMSFPFGLEDCRRSWWRNLLFINNYFPLTESCLGHTWYLAVDFQLYLLAPALILPLIRWRRAGITLIFSAIVTAAVLSGIIAFKYSINPFTLVLESVIENLELHLRLYANPMLHAGPYWIGFLAGYLFTTKPKLKIPLKILLIGWTLAFVCNFSVLYGIHSWSSRLPSVTTRVVYGSISRTFWAVGVAWVIICCSTGHGGIINNILSWKLFIPLSNLSFLVYMLHPIIITIYQGSQRSPTNFSHLNVTWLFFGYLFASILAAFVGCILIEYPFNSLGKMVLKENGRKVEDNPNKLELSNDVNNQHTEKNMKSGNETC